LYYLETFSRGIVFYTLDTSDAQIHRYLKAYLEGKSDEQIWQITIYLRSLEIKDESVKNSRSGIEKTGTEQAAL
jgi:hypothetical protein